MTVTWYGDISSCKSFHWLHDGHVAFRLTFILDPICRAISVIHYHFPTLRKVAQYLALNFTHNVTLPKYIVTQNFYISISQRLRKNLLSEKEKYSKSWFEQDFEFFSTSGSNPEATSTYPAATQQQLALIQQQPSSNKYSSSSSPPATSTYPAAAPQQLALIQQQPSSNKHSSSSSSSAATSIHPAAAQQQQLAFIQQHPSSH